MKCPDCGQDLAGDGGISSLLSNFWKHDCPVSVAEGEANHAKREEAKRKGLFSGPENDARLLAQGEDEDMTLKKVTTFEEVTCDGCLKVEKSHKVNGTDHIPTGWLYVEIFRKPYHLCIDCGEEPISKLVDATLTGKPVASKESKAKEGV